MNPLYLWPIFSAIVAFSLALDLGVIQKLKHKLTKGIKAELTAQTMTTRKAIIWTMIWISLALSFSTIVYAQSGTQAFNEYLAAFTIEKTLSVDNVFMFLLIFSSLALPAHLQRKALTIGILAAIGMRIPLLLVGAELIEAVHWIIYVFGALLIFTSVKMLIEYRKSLKGNHHEKIDTNNNAMIKLLNKIGIKNISVFTSAIVIILATDLIFAIDSIPAVLSVSHEPFIIITSNVFALLGLRALFFAIQSASDKFTYLKPALITILSYIGAKMLVSEYYHIPLEYSLTIIASILATAIIVSVIRQPKRTEKEIIAHERT